jgi:hypothetical protein
MWQPHGHRISRFVVVRDTGNSALGSSCRCNLERSDLAFGTSGFALRAQRPDDSGNIQRKLASLHDGPASTERARRPHRD